MIYTPPVPDAPPPPCYLYVDADQFFFACEVLERGELPADRPVIVGHDPRQFRRGIVTTANSAARALGINSGLSAAIALRLAGPSAIFLPPRHEVYRHHSKRLMQVLRDHSPLVQQNSVDEACLAWDHQGFSRPAALDLRRTVLDATGLSISLGVATSPLVGKMASEVAKRDPEHVCVVAPGAEADFLAPLPIRALVGVGPKSETRLRAQRVETIGDLAQWPLEDLVAQFGSSYGRYLHRASHGLDDSTLPSERAWRSISAESTFAEDCTDRAALWHEVRSQAADVAGRLTKEGLLAGEVAVKLRYADWTLISRQMQLGSPTDDAAVLAAGAAALIRRHWDRAKAIRLIGVRAARLAPRPEGVTQLPLLAS